MVLGKIETEEFYCYLGEIFKDNFFFMKPDFTVVGHHTDLVEDFLDELHVVTNRFSVNSVNDLKPGDQTEDGWTFYRPVWGQKYLVGFVPKGSVLETLVKMSWSSVVHTFVCRRIKRDLKHVDWSSGTHFSPWADICKSSKNNPKSQDLTGSVQTPGGNNKGG